MTLRFQRARKPEEKEVRRQAILHAARMLLREVGASELSLTELARRSRVSKPNVYRYFESREEVLLQVWIEEVRDLTEHLDTVLSTVRLNDLPAFASIITAEFVVRPQLCELTAIVSPVLERNLSGDAILTAKRTLRDLTQRVGNSLHARFPRLPLADCIWVASTVGTYIAGIWPAINSGPTVDGVLNRPEFLGMKPVFERDLHRFVEVLLAGLVSPVTPTPRKGTGTSSAQLAKRGKR